MDYRKTLYHSSEVFLRNAYEIRMAEFGFKNIARMELFLWDLELFLQIQGLVKERIVLKGGAATQFYLPILAQRTSVDIDMIFKGTKEEIEEVLQYISSQLQNEWNLFVFKEHLPQKPKTTLPLHTYFVNIPSVLEAKETRSEIVEGILTQELR